MSWKSFVSAGLLCVLASPVFAAPTVSAVGGGTQSGTNGYLDPNGNWVWQVRIATTNPVPGGAGGTPLAAELGFQQASVRPGNPAGNVVTPEASMNNNPTVWDTQNPGNPIFGWEVPEGSGFPEGVESDVVNQIFSALGSALITSSTPQNYLRIEVERPRTNNATLLSTTTLTLDGAYNSNGDPVTPPTGDRGRVAELTGATTSENFHYQGSVTLRAKAGDTNLDGTISIADYAALEQNFNMNPGSRRWYHGDYNGDNNVTIADYAMLEQNFGPANNYTVLIGSFNNVPPPGAGSGAVAAPEPASVALLALAGLGMAGLRLRRRVNG